MGYERSFFFDHVRRNPFSGRLASGQVAGLAAVLEAWEARNPIEGAAALAYVLATAFHETAATMQPVRETLAKSDQLAVMRLESAYSAGRLRTVKTPYWRYDADGRTWLGRGLVQLTHRRNYQEMSALTGIDLVTAPHRAMEMDVAVKILIEGMRAGSFTGRKLGDYFGPGKSDWVGARKIINGNDRAAQVAGYAKAFAAALRDDAAMAA